MAAELRAERREQLLRKRVVAARAETRVERSGQDVGRDVFVYRRLQRSSVLRPSRQPCR